MAIETVNPHTGKLLKSYDEMSVDETAKIIDQTHEAYLEWQHTDFKLRANLLRKAGEILVNKQDEFATLMAMEMGKAISQGRGEVLKCAKVCNYYADNAEKFLSPREIKTENQKSYVCYRPLGIVFAIMPWNFPFWQVFRYLCPTLMAGNAGLLKHAPISTGTGFAIEGIIKEAGFPENIFKHLALTDDVAASVIKNPKVIAVTLTGSERAGMIVGGLAASNLKKVVLELGGSDPYVICDDADMELAADQIVKSRMNNTGQVCIAAKRVIASPQTTATLQELILPKLDNYIMKDPLEEDCNFGPMARGDLRDEVHAQVEASIKEGATLLKGGKVPDKEGFYYPPTALGNVKPGITAFDKEIFGPVICFIEAKDEKDALKLANQTPYGLGAAVFTKDLEKGERIARDELQAGACFVNSFVASDPRLPFGGIKLSGYGRELSEEGIKEFVNTKTIVVK
jgi:succinate-semialdehyde dehydrogenase/glutarate-semialdehyde dehydrogenase